MQQKFGDAIDLVDLPTFFEPSVTWGWPSSGAVVTTSV
jgi:hypothetical protein